VKRLLAIVLSCIVLHQSLGRMPFLEPLRASVHVLDQQAEVAVVVQDLISKKIVYVHHADHLLLPASVLKLFTASFAWHYLGPRFYFKTMLSRFGTVQKGVVHGGLIWHMSGDPLFSERQIKLLLSQLHRDGVKKIQGAVYVDERALDDHFFGPGWMWDELDDGYAAPVSAIVLDHNQRVAQVVPGAVGSLAKLVFLPGQATNINCQVQTVPDSQAKECTQLLDRQTANQMRLIGCIGAHGGAKKLDIAYHNVRRHFQHAVQRLATQAHIQLPQRWVWQASAMPKQRVQLVDYYNRSLALTDIVTKMLHDSDNLIAEILFKTMAGMWLGKPGTWPKGAVFAQAILRSWVQATPMTMIDGSGLSRYNAVSAEHVRMILDLIFKQQRPLAHALSQPLKPGSLHERLAFARGRIYAKTGSMTGVQNLAGYLDLDGVHPWSFVVMVQHFPGSGKAAQQQVDALIHQLVMLKTRQP
jgi:serine-type D-Ala-D-Ala carboxypeptidase/endopeptidase (penicillin-binding protein 4)